MRPDLEDYEELAENEVPPSRAMSWVVLAAAVLGFAALAYYAYHSGTQSMHDSSMLTVEADATPIKVIPENTDGEEFPNQDKTIYDAITSDASDEAVEKLLPEPESPIIPTPVTPQQAEADTSSFVSKEEGTPKEVADPVDVQSLKQGAPELAPEVEATDATPKPVLLKPAPKKEPEKVIAKPSLPAAVLQKPVVKPAPVVKPVPKPVPVAAASGSYKVQLGAFKSETEARGQWNKITAKNGDVLRGAPVIVRADLPNGTFYRLRASGYASADAAKAACGKLSARGQACFFAGK